MKHISPYLSAKTLGISEEKRRALIGVAEDLITERIPQHMFSMGSWCHCIAGHMRKRIGLPMYAIGIGEDEVLRQLFISPSATRMSTTRKQAGRAVFNYLTTGEPRWDEVLKDAE
jgi:hypothetical protein